MSVVERINSSTDHFVCLLFTRVYYLLSTFNIFDGIKSSNVQFSKRRQKKTQTISYSKFLPEFSFCSEEGLGAVLALKTERQDFVSYC